MAFEVIENAAPWKRDDVLPPNGLRVTPRKLGRKNGGETRWIRLQIGKDLARRLHLTMQVHKVRLLFGTGEDAGKIGIAVDQAAGDFQAKRAANGGSYGIAIGAAAAQGLFAMEFPGFCVIDVEVQSPPNLPKVAIFTATEEFLAAD